MQKSRQGAAGPGGAGRGKVKSGGSGFVPEAHFGCSAAPSRNIYIVTIPISFHEIECNRYILHATDSSIRNNGKF